MRISDWSSDVCSSDLLRIGAIEPARPRRGGGDDGVHQQADPAAGRRLDALAGEPDAAEPAEAARLTAAAPSSTETSDERHLPRYRSRPRGAAVAHGDRKSVV